VPDVPSTSRNRLGPKGEIALIVVWLSLLVTFLWPAVEQSRDRGPNPQPASLVAKWLLDEYGVMGFGAAVFALFAGIAVVLWIMYSWLPKSFRNRVSKFDASFDSFLERFEKVESVRSDFPALIAMCLWLMGALILVFSACNLHVDRTNRRPIVTWVGPLAEHMTPIFLLGLVLSASSFVCAVIAKERYRGRFENAIWFVALLAVMNLAMSLIGWAIAFED
jgi:uncharacterized protein with PQ loop repeat